MHRTILLKAPRVTLRTFSTTPVSRKTVTEKVSEVASDLNKKVGRGLASALETGEKATEKTKEFAGSTSESATEKANKMGDVASQKANKLGAEANATKEEMKDTARK